MKPIYSVVALIFTLGILSCTRHGPPPYVIRDFPDTLQPWLTRAVNTGIVGYDDATVFIKEHATDSEITMLSMAESPILRAIALDQMIQRPGFNHSSVMRAHLDDTAIIFEDVGEWGIRSVFITDYVIQNGRWKTNASRDSLAEDILLHHDGLRSAYRALRFLPQQPEFHDHIMKMALRDKNYQTDIEDALYALAKYKRKEDIPLIRGILIGHEYEFTKGSFNVMTDFPDTGYLEVLEKYYPKRFYRIICRSQLVDVAIGYIRALASYKTDTCAKILSAILHRRPLIPCMADTSSLKDAVIYAIWNNPCRAFAGLRTMIAPDMRELLRHDSTDRLVDSSWYPARTVDDFPAPAEPVRWW